MKLADKVEDILKTLPFTRNSDTALSIEIWKKYFPNFVKGCRVKLSLLHHLPSMKDVSRHRAVIQNNKGLYPPTCYKVAQERSMSRKRWEELTRAV